MPCFDTADGIFVHRFLQYTVKALGVLTHALTRMRCVCRLNVIISHPFVCKEGRSYLFAAFPSLPPAFKLGLNFGTSLLCLAMKNRGKVPVASTLTDRTYMLLVNEIPKTKKCTLFRNKNAFISRLKHQRLFCHSVLSQKWRSYRC
jgi:hypothetical protein